MFSKATIVKSLNLFMSKKHTEIINTLLKYDIPAKIYNCEGSKQKIINRVINYLIENPDLKGIFSDSLQYEIIEEIINYQLKNNYFDEDTKEFKYSRDLYRLLRRDGYSICENKLIRELNSVIEIKKEENLINELLKKHNLSKAKQHLELALNAYTRGEWASSNSQLRTYIEELTKTIAEKLTDKEFKKTHGARVALSKTSPPIFNRDLNEWDDNGTGYFNGFWRRLHPEGSHPGLSTENDCLFRINLVMVNSAEILRRYDDIVKTNNNMINEIRLY